MTEPALSQFNFIDVLKYGAIGISLVCLLLAFWSNQSLARGAARLPEDTLKNLLAHARWTMKFSFACLLAAVAIEAVGHFYIPITLQVEIVPSNLESDAKRMRSLKDIAQPIRVEVAPSTSEVKLTNGSARVSVAANSTILVYVDNMWSAVKTLDNVAYGSQQQANGAAGTLEPHP